MNKKEQKQLEDALTKAAFHRTEKVEPDILPPTDYKELCKGYSFVVSRGYVSISKACTSSNGHCSHSDDKTTSQGSRPLYSSKLLALKAARHATENEACNTLRGIDKLIKDELIKTTNKIN